MGNQLVDLECMAMLAVTPVLLFHVAVSFPQAVSVYSHDVSSSNALLSSILLISEELTCQVSQSKTKEKHDFIQDLQMSSKNWSWGNDNRMFLLG